MREQVSKMMTEAQRKASEIIDAAKTKGQEITDEAEVKRTSTMSQVNAEVEQIRHDIAAQQDEATKKVNELLQHLEERRVAAKREADELVGQAKNTRDQADSYAASKREEADIQAAAIVHKAGEEADAQIEERRAAAQSELDGLSKRIADLQERESVITQRVSELRSMFSQAFSDSLSAVMRRPLVRIRKPLPRRHCRWLRPSRKSSLYTTRPMTSRVS